MAKKNSKTKTTFGDIILEAIEKSKFGPYVARKKATKKIMNSVYMGESE